jgi:hypothetical protein
MAAQLTPRFVGLMVTGALLAGWMGASLTQPAVPAQSGRVSAGPHPIGTAPPSIVQQAERLRQHMAQPPQPARGRNPFTYGPRVPSHRSLSDHEARVVEAPPPLPVVPAPPPMPVFKVSGIASNVEDGEPVLTAILSDNGSMVFAKAGDKLSRGYSVVRVEETSVTLVDAQGLTQTIRLP